MWSLPPERLPSIQWLPALHWVSSLDRRWAISLLARIISRVIREAWMWRHPLNFIGIRTRHTRTCFTQGEGTRSNLEPTLSGFRETHLARISQVASLYSPT